jgi:hypothetical protein
VTLKCNKIKTVPNVKKREAKLKQALAKDERDYQNHFNPSLNSFTVLLQLLKKICNKLLRVYHITKKELASTISSLFCTSSIQSTVTQSLKLILGIYL